MACSGLMVEHCFKMLSGNSLNPIECCVDSIRATRTYHCGAVVQWVRIGAIRRIYHCGVGGRGLDVPLRGRVGASVGYVHRAYHCAAGGGVRVGHTIVLWGVRVGAPVSVA